jgi:hypothetical protein
MPTAASCCRHVVVTPIVNRTEKRQLKVDRVAVCHEATTEHDDADEASTGIATARRYHLSPSVGARVNEAYLSHRGRLWWTQVPRN